MSVDCDKICQAFRLHIHSDNNEDFSLGLFFTLVQRETWLNQNHFPLVLIAKVDSMEDANVAKKKLFNISDNLITVFFNSCWFFQHLNQRSVFQEQAQLKLLLSF